MYDIIIIGSGVTGYAGAMYAGRLGLKTMVIGESLGGTITLTDKVENYPGFKRLTGTELVEKIKEHAKEYDIEEVNARVTKVEKKDNHFAVYADKTYEARSILFATGTKYKELDVPGHDEYKNHGVHYCALCDAFFYKDKVVAVVGGSDAAAKDALVLSRVAKKVYMIYRREHIRPEPLNKKRVQESENIEIINNANVTEIKGDSEKVTGVTLDTEPKELSLDGVFIAIGAVPLSELAQNIGVETNEKKEIITDKQAKTNVPGVFAAGDVTNSIFKQAITGVAEATTAAFFAHQLISQGVGNWK